MVARKWERHDNPQIGLGLDRSQPESGTQATQGLKSLKHKVTKEGFVVVCFTLFFTLSIFFLMHISYVLNIPLFGTKYSDRY